jgi:hypothetical protein
VKALATRDPDVAEKVMREHVQFNVAQQMKMLAAVPPFEETGTCRPRRLSRQKIFLCSNSRCERSLNLIVDSRVFSGIHCFMADD